MKDCVRPVDILFILSVSVDEREFGLFIKGDC